MTLPSNSPMNEVYLNTQLADISTAGSCFVACPVRGKIVKAYSAISAAITTADCTWSLEINNVAVTDSTATIAYSGSAAGDVDSCTPTGANNVNPGDRIEVVSGGESDTTSIGFFTIVVRVQ